MNRTIGFLATLALAFLLAGPAWARPHDPVVKERERNQKARIHEGVKSGELTKGEAKGLRHEQKAIHQEEKAFKSDGKLTRAERRKLHHDQDKASRDIYQEKHDAQKRPGAQ